MIKISYVGLIVAVLVCVGVGSVFFVEKRVKEYYKEEIKVNNDIHEKVYQQLSDQVVFLRKDNDRLKVVNSETTTNLKSEIKKLKLKVKENYREIRKPDGTVEIVRVTESDTNENITTLDQLKKEYEQKIEQVKSTAVEESRKQTETLTSEFSEKEKVYVDKITKLEKLVNPKHYALEVGYLYKDEIYVHSEFDVFGPVFVGVQTQSNFVDIFALGAGLGIRF
jgi:lipopolysaccharide export LptBFGC system permease protein LptF